MQNLSKSSTPINTFNNNNGENKVQRGTTPSSSSSSSHNNHRNSDNNSRSNSPGASATPSNSRRPRRSTSQKVDYDLKKRRIIPSDDYSMKAKLNNGSKSGIVEEGEREGEMEHDGFFNREVIERDEQGNVVNINEPITITDAKNGATGLPLSQGPPEKVKKEYLWSYKKTLSSPNSYISLSSSSNNDTNLELKIYRPNLRTKESESLTKESDIRERITPIDIHVNERDKLIAKDEGVSKKEEDHHNTSHIKIKATISKESKSKLFGQNSIANLPSNSTDTNNGAGLGSPNEVIENDDFCSACLQTGSFLCCDTCPKSFHFLCLNPPLNPDNLPEGDWSCPQCIFKSKYQTSSQAKKLEKEFIQSDLPSNCKVFGKLLFKLQATNPRQFKLPHFVKETFQDVKTGSRDQYCDEKEKDPLSERQLFGSPYGQCITKLDSYNPDIHLDQDTGKVLLCYKCGTTRMGTWDNPEKSRLIMRCDYCRTPWHLDCIPHIPRASLKNLGTNWKCPLHAPAAKLGQRERRLARNQKFTEPSQTCGFKNNGEIDVILDEISAPGSKAMVENLKKNGEFPPIALIKERSLKLDFMDKVYRARKVQRENELKGQEHLIDKLIASSSSSSFSLNNGHKNSNLEDLVSLVYFTLGADPNLKKLWDFKELCSVAQEELTKGSTTTEELKQLEILKKLLESKPKEEVMKFLDLKSSKS